MINFIRKIFDFYIDASVHVAFAVFSLFYFFVKKHHLPYDESLSYTIFYGTILSYNLVKFLPQQSLRNCSLAPHIRYILYFTVVISIWLLYYLFQLPHNILLLFFLGFVLVLGYAYPFLRKTNLRSFPAVKIYIVSFCWAFVIVVIPSIYYQLKFDGLLVVEFIQVFILVVALIIPFDIRDKNQDSLHLQTLPQTYGSANAKIIAAVLLILYILLELMYSKVYVHLVVFLPLIFAIKKMPKKPVKYYCSFGIESFPIILLVAYLIMI